MLRAESLGEVFVGLWRVTLVKVGVDHVYQGPDYLEISLLRGPMIRPGEVVQLNYLPDFNIFCFVD